MTKIPKGRWVRPTVKKYGGTGGVGDVDMLEGSELKSGMYWVQWPNGKIRVKGKNWCLKS